LESDGEHSLGREIVDDHLRAAQPMGSSDKLYEITPDLSRYSCKFCRASG